MLLREPYEKHITGRLSLFLAVARMRNRRPRMRAIGGTGRH